jgi:hypothetical protein
MVTFRIESHSRWDALALARDLRGYRWYLIEPDAQRWDVCIPVEQQSEELPDDLRRTVEHWLQERALEGATVTTVTRSL